MKPIQHFGHKVSKLIANPRNPAYTIVSKMKAPSGQQSLIPCKITSTLQVPRTWMSIIFHSKLLKIHSYLKFRVNYTKMSTGCFSLMRQSVRWGVGLIGCTLTMPMIKIGGEIGIWELVKSLITKLCRVEKEGN